MSITAADIVQKMTADRAKLEQAIKILAKVQSTTSNAAEAGQIMRAREAVDEFMERQHAALVRMRRLLNNQAS